MTASVPVQEGWLVGTDRGEFGGDLRFVTRTGRSHVLWPHNISAILKEGDSILAFSGLAHVTSNHGTVVRLRLVSERATAWVAEPIAELPARAIRAIPQPSGGILVITDRGFVLVDATGQIRPVKCRDRIDDFRLILQPVLDHPRVRELLQFDALTPKRGLVVRHTPELRVPLKLSAGGRPVTWVAEGAQVGSGPVLEFYRPRFDNLTEASLAFSAAGMISAVELRKTAEGGWSVTKLDIAAEEKR